MKEFTYLEISYYPNSGISFIDFLNKMGKDGWEYISQEDVSSIKPALKCLFKKQIR